MSASDAELFDCAVCGEEDVLGENTLMDAGGNLVHADCLEEDES